MLDTFLDRISVGTSVSDRHEAFVFTASAAFVTLAPRWDLAEDADQCAGVRRRWGNVDDDLGGPSHGGCIF